MHCGAELSYRIRMVKENTTRGNPKRSLFDSVVKHVGNYPSMTWDLGGLRIKINCEGSTFMPHLQFDPTIILISPHHYH